MAEENKDDLREEELNLMKKSLPISGYSSSLEASSISIKDRKRSKTEITFMYRPEFVPRPRPKKTDVLPTPFILCEMFEDDQSFEPFLSEADHESEGRMTQGTQVTDNLCANEVSSLFSEMRKELSCILSESSIKHYSKDNESLTRSDNRMNLKDDIRFSAKKSSKRSIWRKYIEIEDMNNLQGRSVRNSMKNGPYSLLRILEAAANESYRTKV